MEPICGVPKILQKRINFPTFVGGGGGKTGKELFPPYEVFFLKASLTPPSSDEQSMACLLACRLVIVSGVTQGNS